METLSIFLLTSAFAIASGQSADQPFTLTIRDSKTTEIAGSDIFIWVKMTNTSDHVVDCTAGQMDGTDVSYHYDAWDENAKPVHKIDYGIPYISGAHISSHGAICNLEPGKSFEKELIISYLYDFSKSGKYQIQLSRRASLDSNGYRVGEFVKSNIITITVLPAESKPMVEVEPAEGSIPSADEPSSETTKQPFSIKINAGHSHVKVGDPVYVGIEMRNTSDHEIDCTAMTGNNGIDGNFQYEFFDEYGAPAPKIAPGKTFPEAIPCTLKPENNYSTGGEISRIFDFSRPGKYTIQLSRPIWGNDQIPETGRTVQNGQTVVKSNKITITVLPADDQPTQAPAPK